MDFTAGHKATFIIERCGAYSCITSSMRMEVELATAALRWISEIPFGKWLLVNALEVCVWKILPQIVNTHCVITPTRGHFALLSRPCWYTWKCKGWLAVQRSTSSRNTVVGHGRHVIVCKQLPIIWGLFTKFRNTFKKKKGGGKGK